MDALQLNDCAHDRRLTDEYLDLLRRVNAGDRRWVPPLRRATHAALGPANPFFERDGNRHRVFALRRGSKLVGHVLATAHRQHVVDGERVGALGFLGVEPDFDTFWRLIRPAIAWLREEVGAGWVWATMEFDVWHGYRVMTKGFEEDPFFGEPRNPPWLPDFLERAGFSIRKSWFSTVRDREFFSRRVGVFRERYERVLASGYQLEPLRVRSRSRRRELHSAVCRAFAGFDMYTPIDEKDFGSLVGRLLRWSGTRLSTGLRSPEGELVGFSVVVPDPIRGLHMLDGEDGWGARWRWLWRRPRAESAILYMIGVVPAAPGACHGLGSALLYRTAGKVLESEYDRTTLALLADDSPARFFATDLEDSAERRYSLFERATTEEPRASSRARSTRENTCE